MRPSTRLAFRAALILALSAARAIAQPAAAAPRASVSSPRSESAAQPGSDPGGQRVTGQTPLRTGQAVAIEWHGTWYAGHVVAIVSTNSVHVHYDGYDVTSDENVSRSRLRLDANITAAHPGPVEPSGTPVTPGTILTPGLAVYVVWHGQWWSARVVSLFADGQVVIRYDGYQADADEIVTRDRLLVAVPAVAQGSSSPPSPGRVVDVQTPLAPGDAVHAEWQGNFYPSRVVSFIDPTHVRIHYLGYGSDSDENVERARLRVGASSRMIIRPGSGAP